MFTGLTLLSRRIADPPSETLVPTLLGAENSTASGQCSATDRRMDIDSSCDGRAALDVHKSEIDLHTMIPAGPPPSHSSVELPLNSARGKRRRPGKDPMVPANSQPCEASGPANSGEAHATLFGSDATRCVGWDRSAISTQHDCCSVVHSPTRQRIDSYFGCRSQGGGPVDGSATLDSEDRCVHLPL